MAKTIEFSARASLVILGARFQCLGLWSVVAEHVKIKQKVLTHAPLDKLLDALINILAGGAGVVEINCRFARASPTCYNGTIPDSRRTDGSLYRYAPGWDAEHRRPEGTADTTSTFKTGIAVRTTRRQQCA